LERASGLFAVAEDKRRGGTVVSSTAFAGEEVRISAEKAKSPKERLLKERKHKPLVRQKYE